MSYGGPLRFLSGKVNIGEVLFPADLSLALLGTNLRNKDILETRNHGGLKLTRICLEVYEEGNKTIG